MSGQSQPTAARVRPAALARRTRAGRDREPADGQRRDGGRGRRRETPVVAVPDQRRNDGDDSSHLGVHRVDDSPLVVGQRRAANERSVRDQPVRNDNSQQIGQHCRDEETPGCSQLRDVGSRAVVGQLRDNHEAISLDRQRDNSNSSPIGQRGENSEGLAGGRLRDDGNPVGDRSRSRENSADNRFWGNENLAWGRSGRSRNPAPDRLRNNENPVWGRLRGLIENRVGGRLRGHNENPAHDRLRGDENPAEIDQQRGNDGGQDRRGDGEREPRESQAVRLRLQEAEHRQWPAEEDYPLEAEMTSTGPGGRESLRQDQQTMEGGDSAQSVAAIQLQESRILKDENNFIQNVSQFFNQEDISDVVLKVGEKKFFAHKFVLAKSSEVFRTMLYDKRWQQAGLPEIDLEESEECQRHFEPFLRFLYTAEVQISTESAVGILCLADKYSVMSLKNLCTQYMVENTLSPKVRNALNWYSWAKALLMDELIDSCTKTISWNMEQLVALPEWLQMEIDFVADILSNPQLVVSNEHLLYSAVERWLLHDNHLADLSENSKKLLPLVRFPQMMVQQLYKVETGDLASKEGSKDLIEKLLNQAYRFRSLCPFQAELNITFNDEFYRPRNYKDLTVDTVRMQNTLRFGIQVDVRTYVGPVPSTVREGEWKITYRKSNDTWTLQVYCHDSAMVNGEARIQAVLVISDDEDRVLQVEASEETVCSRGNHLSMVITLPGNNEAKLMTVLIKPLPN